MSVPSNHPEESSPPPRESAADLDQQPKSRISDDLLAIACAALLLVVSFLAVFLSPIEQVSDGKTKLKSPVAGWVGKPGGWTQTPLDTLRKLNDEGDVLSYAPTIGVLGTLLVLCLVLCPAIRFRDGPGKALPFLFAFLIVFGLAAVAYVLSAQSLVKAYNLEYALWALLVGLVISNTIGTPGLIKPAVQTEFFIKTGLVLLGAEVLMSRLLALGLPGIFVAWIVTPIVLISTYIFGQRVLKMESKSLNMVIAADMSVCGVSAAIASAAACKAKKEELSLAIGMSLSFTVVMMVVLPIVIRLCGMGEVLGGAWMGGTIDSTGAVAAAGATLGETGEQVAATVKMIQNILIGVSAFGIATYWVTVVEKTPGAKADPMEIVRRFPKFVLGFLVASIVFSCIHGLMDQGPLFVDAMIKDSTKVFRGWFFCLAFVSIGLETRFRDLWPYFRGGKPVVLYVCGQGLNLVLTLLMAWLMFEVIFKDFIEQMSK